MINQELKIVNISELKPKPNNRNFHPEEQIERLAEIIRVQGFRRPIIVSNQSGEIVCGHGRLMAAKKLGMTEVPVLFQDYATPELEYADHIADNAVPLWASLDFSGINSDLGDLGPNFDIDLLGIKDFVLEPAELIPQCDEDEVPEHVEPKTKLGDIYQLGNHRLMCGDSTSIDAVDKLMNGEKADMVFTDPPYGVNYDGGHANENRRTKLENDDKTLMYSGSLPMAYLASNDKAPLYLWFADRFSFDVIKALNDNSYSIRNWIIWNKNLAQFGAIGAQYKSKHEPCIYAFKKGFSPIWDGPNNEVTVWDVKRESKNEHHPTQKPVELCERAITNHNPKSVLDLFGGSGSTLIACEKTNRKCFMSELDPHYCDVIVQRWMKYSGKMAYLIEDSSGKLNEPVSYAEMDFFRGENIGGESKNIAQKSAGQSAGSIGEKVV